MPFYNEIDPFPARWLQNLMDIDLIPEGTIDRRSIEDLTSEDTAPISHFFAGIGGWPYALRLAGWSDTRPVWTGSCPCQPFSKAGRGRGVEDERHLWPAWFRFIRECRPPTIFGEQVASPAGLAWLDLVSADLEGLGYTFGAADLCAASLGAPHIRQRLFFVGHTGCKGSGGYARTVPCSERKSAGKRKGTRDLTHELEPSSFMGHSGESRHEGRSLSARERYTKCSPWSPSDLVWCRDGKWRDVEPGSFPLAHGVPGRVGRLRAYGNAIVPQLAATFIRATCEAIEEVG
jgi:DNA (cytosine-5)-methyltransferase 1